MAPTKVSGPRLAFGLSLLWGTIYGVVVRLLADTTIGAEGGTLFWVMSLAFLVVTPFAIGYLTVRPQESHSMAYRLCAPWIPLAVGTTIAMVVGWEGSICVIIGAPIMLVAASLGGLVSGRTRRRAPLPAVLALPLIAAIIESRWVPPTRLQRVETAITIQATPSRIWEEIASVREIAPAELPGALYLRMGFPRPLSAVIDHDGVGGIRQARFAGGVLFLETVTEWRENQRLSFRIVAQTDSIAPGTLDPHVIVGGQYFDVLQGTYTIDSVGPSTSILRLASDLRITTNFNWYAAPWANAIMSSIQNTILQVQKARAESVTNAT